MTEELECLDSYNSSCVGVIELRPSLTGTGTSIPRCNKHWEDRLDEEERIRERYPYNAPSDFDPSYAGERWDDDY